MKSILVPTDFSACAANAVDTAMQLAKRFEATVHLYSRIDLPRNWETMTSTEREHNSEALQTIENAKTLMENIREKYPEATIETALSGGKLIENIKDFVNKYGIDLIVIGSHGARGKNEFFIGSNAQKVIRLVHCPVLVIKEKLENVDFRKVVFASSFNQNEQETFLRFKDFVKDFSPEIHLLAIQTSSLFDRPYMVLQEAMEDFQKLAEPLNSTVHISQNFSVDSGVRFAAKEIGANLIAVSNHHRHPMIRIFAGSNVEALVNHSNLPVLSIDYVKENTEK